MRQGKSSQRESPNSSKRGVLAERSSSQQAQTIRSAKMSSDLATGRPLVTSASVFSRDQRKCLVAVKSYEEVKKSNSRKQTSPEKFGGDGEREEKEATDGRQRHVYLSCFLR